MDDAQNPAEAAVMAKAGLVRCHVCLTKMDVSPETTAFVLAPSLMVVRVAMAICPTCSRVDLFSAKACGIPDPSELDSDWLSDKFGELQKQFDRLQGVRR